MRRSIRTWPVPLFGLVSLLALIVFSVAATKMADQSYHEMAAIHQSYWNSLEPVFNWSAEEKARVRELGGSMMIRPFQG